MRDDRLTLWMLLWSALIFPLSENYQQILVVSFKLGFVFLWERRFYLVWQNMSLRIFINFLFYFGFPYIEI